MEKRNDRLLLSWARLCAAIFVVVVAIATSTAKADIPPAIEHGIAGTPTEQKLVQGGWNPSNNTLNPTKAKETFTSCQRQFKFDPFGYSFGNPNLTPSG